MKKEFNDINIKISWRILTYIKMNKLVLLASFGIIAVFTMVFYDYFIVKHIKSDIKAKEYVLISWIANTFNNVCNLGGVTGTGLRALLYKDKVKNRNDMKYPLYIQFMSTPSGLAILSAFSLIIIFT